MAASYAPGPDDPVALSAREKRILSLLERALTHRSYVNENPNSPLDNERLEFLGDAVLDFIVGASAFNDDRTVM